MRKSAQFDERSKKMRDKYAVTPDPLLRTRAARERLERQQAFVYGFEAAKQTPDDKRAKNPFSDDALQRAWRRGYKMGKKGLKVKLKLP